MVMLKVFTYIVLFLTLYIFYVTNSVLLEPYMDEIFHFPQAVAYYKGNYSDWNPKITTPPGLYLVSVAILHPVAWLTTLDVTRVQCFRLVNIMFTVGIMFTVYTILEHFLKNEKYITKDRKRITLLSSVNITLFPVLYFFNFLYYTDSGSTFFVLLMYSSHLKRVRLAASVAGAISLLFRQTNIIWIFFVAADESLCYLFSMISKELKKKEKDIKSMTFSQFTKASIPVIRENWKVMSLNLIQLNPGYIIIALGFLMFIKINGSIVLGDKEAHQACCHVPQLFYFFLFFQCFASPYLISWNNLKDFYRFIRNNKLFVFELFMVCVLCISFFSHVHPYLIADNRHYTFYIWKRILGRNLFMKYALIPIYIYCGWSLMHAMEHKDYIFQLVAFICVFLSVVPQRLLEFRYFIIPYIILRLHLKVKSKLQPFLEFILYGIVNFIVFYMFFFKTFNKEGSVSWGEPEKIQRFMW